MSTPIALLEVAAKSGGPAVAKIPKRFPLLARKDVTSQKIALVSADHIGQFQPMICHPWIETRGSDSDSKGLVVARTVASASCKIARRSFQMRVAEQDLNGAEIDARFE